MIRLRQVALVVHDLDAVVADLGRLLGLEVAFNDPGVEMFGLRNAVLPVGTQFIEVVSPITAGTAAGRQLERLGADGGYMFSASVSPSISASRCGATASRAQPTASPVAHWTVP